MKVQVLYFAGCPNHEATTELMREVARELRLSVDVEEVEVMSAEDAARLRFLGSPSVYVNGVDIEPSARSSVAYAFACRTCDGQGVPPRDLLVAALKEADTGPAAESSRRRHPALPCSSLPCRCGSEPEDIRNALAELDFVAVPGHLQPRGEFGMFGVATVIVVKTTPPVEVVLRLS